MGDGITTSFDVFVLIVITAGIPTLIFGLPIGALVFLSLRRKRLMAARVSPNSRRSFSGIAWLFGLLAIVAVGVLVFLMTAVSFTT